MNSRSRRASHPRGFAQGGGTLACVGVACGGPAVTDDL
jgi:hypothetical protein